MSELKLKIPSIRSFVVNLDASYNLRIHRAYDDIYHKYHVRKGLYEIYRDEDNIFLIDSEDRFNRFLDGKNIDEIEGDIEVYGLFVYFAPFDMPRGMEEEIVHAVRMLESPLKDQGSPICAYSFSKVTPQGSIEGIYFSDIGGVYIEGNDGETENHAWKNIIIRGGMM